jgi:hypothetical protein
MSIIGSNILAGSSGQGGGYEIEQSLRFNSADSAYLNRTPAAGSNRQAFTLSFWVKKTGPLAAFNYGIIGNYTDGNNSNEIYFNNQDRLLFYDNQSGTDYGYGWTLVFRDPSAWYHIVIVLDTTNATAADRLKLYVNGVRQTDVSLNYGDFPLNYQVRLLSNSYTHYIGRGYSPAEYGNYYLAEYNLVDGTALDPSSFGEYDNNGVWRPIEYTGSYGTNGFFLTFDPSATNGIGHDHSGNGNNFSPSGFTTSGTGTDVMSDTPTNNHPTIVPINPNYTYVTTTPTDGNLVASFYPNAGTGNPGAPALTTFTIPTTGKWYYEFTVSGALNHSWGIAARTDGNNLYDFTLGSRAFWGWYHIYQAGFPSNGNEGFIYSPGSGTVSGGGSLSLGDVIGVAIDFSNSSITFTQNGSSYGTITSCNFSSFTEVVPQWGTGTNGISGATITLNMGQRAFAYTPPSGHKAVCTANLPAPTIKDGSKYFDTTLYTGNSTARTISTNSTFTPDFIWIKGRSGAYNHSLQDVVRGFASGKAMGTNLTSAESGISTQAGYVDGVGAGTFDLNADATATWYHVNVSGQTYVAWAWDAGGTGSSNTDGSITSTVSANPSAGFSIATYTGTGTAGTVGHGLGVAPRFAIVKKRSGGTMGGGYSDWLVYSQALVDSGAGSDAFLYLNTTGATSNSSSVFGSAPTSTVFNIGNNQIINNSSSLFVAYCFAEVEGYSKFGSYTGKQF